MTLLYIDGLEDSIGVRGTGGTVAYNIPARTGNGIRVSGSGGSFNMAMPTPLSDTVTIGFAWRPTSVSGTNFSPPPLQLWGDVGSVGHLSMNVAAGNLSIVRGTSSSPVIASTTTPPFPTANRWYFIELQAKISDTVGFVTVNVDGVNVLTSATTLDTRNGGVSPNIDVIQFGMGVSGTTIFDDLYIMAGAGDTFLGDCTVSTLFPDGNGSVNQFVGSDGDSVDNYQLVDESPSSAVDYVASATVGHQDLYTLGDLIGAPTVLAVAPTIYVAKDEVGGRQVKPLVRSGSTTAAGVAVPLDFAYAQKQSIFMTNPSTGLDWTAADVNGLQAGVEVV